MAVEDSRPESKSAIEAGDAKTTAPASPQSPRNLKELLGLAPSELEKCDLALINLLCAEGLRGADEPVQQSLDTLESWVRHVASETQRNFHRYLENPKAYNQSLAYYRMIMLATVLQQDFQAQYNPERAIPQLRGEWEPSDEFFADSKDVFIHGLLGGKHFGTCASLPVLFVAVAQRLGYPVSLAAAKGHFYVRYDDGDRHLNVEATSIGFNTYPDEFYRNWPHPITSDEARTYGLLRPLSNQEVLGQFLTIRALGLTSMKRFDEAAESWTQAARLLPETPVLKQLVERARQRARHKRDADRWDTLAEEVQRMPIPAGPQFEHLQDRKVQVRLFMNQSVDLDAIEKAVNELRNELAMYRKVMMQASDSPAAGESSQPPPAHLPENISALTEAAFAPQGRRIAISEARVPPEYRESIPPKLLERLQDLTREDDIVVEMWAYHAEEIGRRNREMMETAAKALQPTRRLDVPRDWLPAEYQQSVPPELVKRLNGLTSPERVRLEVQRYELEQENERQRAAMKLLMSQSFEPGRPTLPFHTHPPLQIQIVPTKKGEP